MTFDGFGVRQPLVSMVYDSCPPLVQQWNGYLPSLKSIRVYESNTCLLFRIHKSNKCILSRIHKSNCWMRRLAEVLSQSCWLFCRSHLTNQFLKYFSYGCILWHDKPCRSYSNKLASLEATLVRNSAHSLTYSLTLKCRATSVAKNQFINCTSNQLYWLLIHPLIFCNI